MDQTETLSITLTAEQAEFIRQRVESGAYASASEVVRAGLRALDKDDEEHRERLNTIRQRIKSSIEDPRPAVPLDEVMRRMRARIDASPTASDETT